MFKSLALILFTGAVSIYHSDLDSDSAITSILLPVVSVLALIALALWMVTW